MKFSAISIIGTHVNPLVAETVRQLQSLLADKAALYFEHDTAGSLANVDAVTILPLEELPCYTDLAIVVGGDGNFLNAARVLSLVREIPIIGINRGKLGFLTDITPHQLETRLMQVLEGAYYHEKRFMIEVSACDAGQHWLGKAYALNEVVLASGNTTRLFEMTVTVDGHHAFAQRSDGIIIATPTGSTAHALSAGGPIMHPSLDVVVMVPMFSHTLSARPIVLSAHSDISIRVEDYNDPSPIVSTDGHSVYTLAPGSSIQLGKCAKSVNMLHPYDYDYYRSLREKLHWSKLLRE